MKKLSSHKPLTSSNNSQANRDAVSPPIDQTTLDVDNADHSRFKTELFTLYSVNDHQHFCHLATKKTSKS